MLNIIDNENFVTLEYYLPKFNPKAIWVDFAVDKNQPVISFCEIMHELKSFSLAYGECAIKNVVIQLTENSGRILLENHHGLNFRSYVNYLHETYDDYKYLVEKCVIELIKPLIWLENDKIKNKVEELQKEVDIIYNELDLLRKRSRKKNKSKRRLISGRKRQNILARDNYRCQICGATVEDGAKLEIDHIKPFSKGGSNHENNLQVLCQRCNREKHNRDDLPHDKRKLKKLNKPI